MRGRGFFSPRGPRGCPLTGAEPRSKGGYLRLPILRASRKLGSEEKDGTPKVLQLRAQAAALGRGGSFAGLRREDQLLSPSAAFEDRAAFRIPVGIPTEEDYPLPAPELCAPSGPDSVLNLTHGGVTALTAPANAEVAPRVPAAAPDVDAELVYRTVGVAVALIRAGACLSL